MKGKLCMVTGASGGLGKATAEALAALGASVILLCRDGARGEAVKQSIRSATGNPSVELLLCDLSSLQSVRTAVASLGQDKLDVLINNAAVYKVKRSVTADGFEAMFATNHLGPFLLTHLLLPKLKAASPSRIIFVTAPSTTRLQWDNLQGEKGYSAFASFGASKMCNNLMTFELARRLAGSGVTVNALHPGLVKSNLMGEAPAPIRFITSLISVAPEKSAVAAIYLATSPEVAGVTGKFMKGKKTLTPSAYAQDPEVQRRLWDLSVKLTGLT